MHSITEKSTRSRPRQGLVLLVVLGMLGLFTLLAITYLSVSTQSRVASQSVVRAKLQPRIENTVNPDVIAQRIISGDGGNQSAFFGHSLLEDIYGRDAIEGEFLVPKTTDPKSAVLNVAGKIGLLKVQLNNVNRSNINPDPHRNTASTTPDEGIAQSFLSVENDTYTGRLITFLEGPLANQTYRILGYVGAPTPAPPAGLEYSIAIDLAETEGSQLAYSVVRGSQRLSYSGTLRELLSANGGDPSFLIEKKLGTNATVGEGFRFVINDLPFNGFGYGIENDSSYAGFGSLDQRRLVPGSGSGAGGESLPIALLPHYDYLKKETNSGALGSGQVNGSGAYVEVTGSTNEGFDVADFHDFFLAHLPAQAGAMPTTGEIIPSFHRPELVNYIANQFTAGGTPLSGITPAQVRRLVTLVDYACARPLSYTIRQNGNVVVQKNPGFLGRSDNKHIPALEIELNNWGTGTEEGKLQAWIQALVGGGTPAPHHWDIDNDGDGVADSVWVNPNLPTTTSPEGRYLKVLVAPMILDLDARINLNTSGDFSQTDYLATTGYKTDSLPGVGGPDLHFSRNDPGTLAGIFLPQGLGYGPAEIFLPRLATTSTLNVFNTRTGADKFPGRPGNDTIGRFFAQREMRFNGAQSYGLKQSRRGSLAYGIDPYGNVRMSELQAGVSDERNDETYESNGINDTTGDTPYLVTEMESLLRRYDRDAAELPDRIRSQIGASVALNDTIYRCLTTRSVELRYPSLAAVSRHTQTYSNTLYPRANGGSGTNQTIPVGTPTAPRLVTNGRVDGSMLRWIQMLYEERYADRLIGGTPKILELSDIRDLFPLEFRKGMRLDINRAFGNGIDDDPDAAGPLLADGVVDDPTELASTTVQQQETYLDGTKVQGTYAITNYPPASPPNADYSTYNDRLLSRKMLARQLYCLAQLLVARDYPFAGIQPPAGNLSNPAYLRARARELAQWAVNVVDFRDQDSAMTRFEYDETPFERDVVGAATDTSVWEPKSGCVVWGMEFPELLMTETLAFHDLRLKDTPDDNLSDPDGATAAGTTVNPDPAYQDADFDQYRIPQGSLFIELFCPRSPNAPVGNVATGDTDLGTAPSSLYDTTSRELILSRMAPASATYGQQPVFRIGIAEPPAPGVTGSVTRPGRDPQSILNSNPIAYDQLEQITNQTSVSTDVINTTTTGYTSSGLVNEIGDIDPSAAAQPFRFDRMIWFTNTLPAPDQYVPNLRNCETPGGGNAETSHRIFRNQGGAGTLSIPGGGYMVIGPRRVTPIGSTPDGFPGAANYSPSPQVIDLSVPNTVTVKDVTGAPRSLGGTFPTPKPVTMIATATPPTPAWIPLPDFLDNGIGVNVSEPLPLAGSYYALPTYQINPGATNTFPTDGYRDGTVGLFPDTPFDYNPSAGPIPGTLETEGKHLQGTYLNHRTAYLQRLADPEQAYHPLYNPYITIDWMSIDLTVFNGEATQAANPKETGNARSVAFQTRYKDGGRINDFLPQGTNPATAASPIGRYTAYQTLPGGAKQTGVSIFSSSTAQVIATAPDLSAAIPPYFAHVLGVQTPPGTWSSASLGFLNIGREVAPQQYDGFGSTVPTSIGDPRYEWAPQTPQAGLVWLNRPFASPYEIMLVPRVGPGQLGQTFTTPENNTTGRYETTPRGGPSFLPFFGYLPNFFSSEVPKTTSGGTPPTYWQRPETPSATVGANWHLLLELIETAPPFADAERWIDPNVIYDYTPPINPSNIQSYLLAQYRAPFNFFSRYQVAGKVNLNTLAEKGVWDALEGNYDSRARNTTNTNVNATKWAQFIAQRRGYTPTAGSFLTPAQANPRLNGDLPTQFARPYRPGFGTNMEVPPLQNERAVNRGLLRPNITALGPPATLSNDEMLLNAESAAQHANPSSPAAAGPAPANPATPDEKIAARIDAEITRQPFSNFQRAMRLPNLTTNQSNVFAIWITVGLFEYDEVNGIGAEYIGPSGTPERTRTFYIVDRSIPVGFAPGKAYNSEKTILLRRKLPR